MRSADAAPILDIRGLRKWFGARKGFLVRPRPPVRAVDDVSFLVHRGEVVGLVGESGSGKTTVGHSIVRLLDSDAGEIRFDGVDLARMSEAELKPYRRRIQMVFQDPFSSLNPRMTIEQILSEPLEIHRLCTDRAARRQRVIELLATVGLFASHARRYPHEFSGGQRQRIGIARALAVEPELIVADEPVSALDVSIQAQVIELLEDLKERLGLTLLLIAHDLAVIKYVSDRVVVMYLGRVMEIGPVRELYRAPLHPYTEALLSAAPVINPAARRRRIVLKGDLPSPSNPPSGCVFRTRCPYAIADCAAVVPPLREVAPGRLKACIRDDIP